MVLTDRVAALLAAAESIERLASGAKIEGHAPGDTCRWRISHAVWDCQHTVPEWREAWAEKMAELERDLRGPGGGGG